MKRFKKLTSLLLTLIITIAMTIPVFAIGETGSIIINGTKAKGNFESYRIFAIDNVDYTLEKDFEGFFKEKYPEMSTLTGEELSNKAYEKVKSIQNGTAKTKVDFSKEVLKWVKENKKLATKTTPAVEGTTTIDSLPYGFYMFYSPSATGELGTGNEKTPAMMVDVHDKTVEVTLKSEYPTVDKNIIQGITDPDDIIQNGGNININDNWEANHGMDLESIPSGNKASDFKVGDEVTFELTAKVPDMTGFNKFTFKFKDTLSEGLTFKAIQKVTVGNQTITPVSKGQEANNTYSANITGQNLEITMNNFLESYKDKVGQEIKVVYRAVLNEKALAGMKPNTNEAKIEFSNNPGSEATEESEPSIVDVHTLGFEIFKFHDNDIGLQGAEFNLYTDETCTDDNKIKLKKVDENNYIVSTDTSDDTIITPNNGKVNVKGLKAGTYYLKETKEPNGYHKLKSPIKIEISAKYNNITGKLESFKVDYTYEGKTVTGTEHADKETLPIIKIENKKGEGFLPNTGGMGTVLFTVVGILLILGVGISFSRSRRKEHN